MASSSAITHDRSPLADSASTPAAAQIVMGFARFVQRRWNVMLQSLMIAGAAGLIYCTLATPQYESAARLLIFVPQQNQLASLAGPLSSENLMTTHSELVTSQVVVGGALRRLAPDYRVDLVDVPPEEWIETLSRRLAASTSHRTNFIDVSYRSKHPVAAAAVVRSVIESYLAFVRETHQGDDQLQQSLRRAAEREKQRAAAFEKARHVAAEDSERIVELTMLAQIEKLDGLLLDRMASIEGRQMLAPLQVKVVREPLPAQHPVTPQLPLVVIASLVGGLLLGAGVGYVRDTLDSRAAGAANLVATNILAASVTTVDVNNGKSDAPEAIETTDAPAAETTTSAAFDEHSVDNHIDDGIDLDAAANVLPYRPATLPGAAEVRDLIRPRRAA